MSGPRRLDEHMEAIIEAIEATDGPFPYEIFKPLTGMTAFNFVEDLLRAGFIHELDTRYPSALRGDLNPADFEPKRYIYRLYDSDRRLLYIGCTGDVEGRLTQHRLTKPWWLEVDDMDTELVVGYRKSMELERDAIRAERPRYNIRHNQRVQA